MDGPSSIPPGDISPAVFEHLDKLRATVIPPPLRPLFAGDRDTVSVQPMSDEAVDHHVSGRVALIGDAATLARPHTGSGATKAMQDAMLIETHGAKSDDWDQLLADADESPPDAAPTFARHGGPARCLAPTTACRDQVAVRPVENHVTR